MFGERRAHHPAAAVLVDRPFADLEDADPVPGPARPGGHLRRARERPLRTGRPGRALRPAEYAADALAVLDATGTDRAVVVVAVPRRVLRAAPGRRPAGAGRRARSSSARPRRWLRSRRPGCPSRGGSRKRSTATRAGPRTTPTTGCATTPGSWSSSSRRCSPSRTRPSRSRTGSAGAWRPRPRRWPTRGADAIRDARDDISPLLAAAAARCLVIQGAEDAIVGPGAGRKLAAALACAGPAGRAGGLRPLAPCPRPGQGQPPHPRLRRAPGITRKRADPARSTRA